MPSGSLASGSPKTMMPPAMAETLAAAAVRVMTGTASPFWRPRAEAKKAMTEASDAGGEPGRQQARRRRAWPICAGERLDRDVGDAEQDSGGHAEQDPVVLVRRAELVGHHEQRADDEEAGLEGDHRRGRVARVRAAGGRKRDRQQHEAEGGEADAEPLAAADAEAEDALGEDREEDEAAGDDGLDERERRERHRRDVEAPGADAPPACRSRTTSSGTARAPLRSGCRHVDVRRRAGAPVLAQEAQVRGESAEER